jgi:anaphase-promoting complex subunit 7
MLAGKSTAGDGPGAGYERAAIACFKECLRICPFALEAMTALAQLGVRGDELRALLPPAAQMAFATAAAAAAEGGEAMDQGDERGAAGEEMDEDVDETGEGQGSKEAAAAKAAATGWLWRLAEGHAALASHDNDAAVVHFTQLSNMFPDNLHAGLARAAAEAARGDHAAAAHLFARCRAGGVLTTSTPPTLRPDQPSPCVCMSNEHLP